MTWRANKSQFSKMPVPNGRKKSGQIYIDPEAFYLMRRRAGLTSQQAAIELDVTHKTVLNWEKGYSRIPYTAFRVLKLKVGYVFDDEFFHDWFVRGDTLWSPEGRGFKPHELRYIGNYFWMARQWLADRKAAKPKTYEDLNIVRGSASDGSPIPPAGKPSGATGTRPSGGVAPIQTRFSESEKLLSQQEKPEDFERFLASLGIPA